MIRMSTTTDDMYVIKRDGEQHAVSFDTIQARINELCDMEPKIHIKCADLAIKIIEQMYSGISTDLIDELTAQQCASQNTTLTSYGHLASRITTSNLHKRTTNSFSSAMATLYQFKDVNGIHKPIIADHIHKFIENNAEKLDSMIVHSRDYDIDYFGMKTLERAYLTKVGGKIVERPQYMWMRVACGIHIRNKVRNYTPNDSIVLAQIAETYHLLSNKFFTHATPTLFNSGTPHPQLSSCYLLGMENDSIDGIYNTLGDCAAISKWAGGIGLHIHNVRGKGSHIRGTNGTSNGIVPMLRVFNMTARYVDQCFTGSTLVYSENGPKLIKDVEVGDSIINGAGQLDAIREKVEFLHHGKIMKINVSGATQTVFVTPKHPFLVVRDGAGSDGDIEMGIKNGVAFPEYVAANDLVLTDKMVVPNASMEDSTTECNYLTINSISYEIVPESQPIPVFDLKMTTSTQPSYLTEMGVCHNGGGKRNGSFAIYLEPWHPDIESFLDLKKNTGDEEQRARDLFYALWTPGLFMERVKTNQKWSLFCPDKCPGLANVYGDEFNALYELYESQGLAEKQVSARDIWFRVLDSQMETGTPYIMYKDACNQKSNQKNIGTIKSSNLCTEIVQYSDDKETAVCNLASINLTKFVTRPTPEWTFNQIVVIYTKPNCQYCIRAKMLMDDFGIAYNEYNVSDDEKRAIMYSEMSTLAGKPINTVPQIITFPDQDGAHTTTGDANHVEDAVYVGGFKDLQQKCKYQFDYSELQKTVHVIVRNLNKIINVNFYPTLKTKRSNLLHRPMGIGVQGLADTFQMMDLVFTGTEAAELNCKIFASIYHAAVTESCAISERRCSDMGAIYAAYKDGEIAFGPDPDDEVNSWSEDGNVNSIIADTTPIRAEMEMMERLYAVGSAPTTLGAYSSFHGSPLSKGELQFDLWNVAPNSMYDWDELRANVIKYGVRNSLLVAPMPTASTSQILGNNECFEPMTSNLYSRRTNAGEFIIANRHLMGELERMGIWNVDLKNEIIRNGGSIRGIDVIPADLREKYEIAWEMPMKTIIEMARDRGIYTCQSQSMNLWVADPNYKNLTALHFKSWELGLKTGSYYLRRKPKHRPQQFTIAPTTRGNSAVIANEIPVDTSKTEDGCDMCSG